MKQVSGRIIGMAVWFMLLIMPAFALAEQPLPPVGSPSRILWIMRCAGKMPPLLFWSLAAILVLTVISAIWYWQMKKSHEE